MHCQADRPQWIDETKSFTSPTNSHTVRTCAFYHEHVISSLRWINKHVSRTQSKNTDVFVIPIPKTYLNLFWQSVQKWNLRVQDRAVTLLKNCLSSCSLATDSLSKINWSCCLCQHTLYTLASKWTSLGLQMRSSWNNKDNWSYMSKSIQLCTASKDSPQIQIGQ